MATDRTLQEGDPVAGCTVVRPIASGASGNVYLARDPERDEPVAVREYLPRGLAGRDEDGEVVALFAGAEAAFEAGRANCVARANAFLGFDHPQVANIRKVVEERGTVYVVMDHAPGSALSNRLGPGETLAERELVAWFDQVADGLAALHGAGLAHGNFGLGTVVVDDDGAARILGLAVPTHDAFGVIANPAHAPLESYPGRPELSDSRVDVYSLGTVLYRCVTGVAAPEAPVRADRDTLVPAVRAARGSYRPSVLGAIDAALALQPEARPDMGTLRDALASAAEAPAAESDDDVPDAAPAGARAAVRKRRTTRPPRRTKRLALVAASVVLVAVVAGMVAWLATDEADAPDTEVALADPTPVPDEVAPVAESSPVSGDAEGDADPARVPDDGEEHVAARPAEPDDADDPTATPEPAPAQTVALPSTGELAVDTTPDGAEVFVNGAKLGETPLRLTDLAVGDYNVLLRHGDYVDVETTVTVSATQAELTRTLERATGALAVSTTPNAWVDVDGVRMADSTPATLTLPTGTVTLTLGATGYEPLEVETRVPKDGTATVEFGLTRTQGTLTLALTPDDAEVALPDSGEAYVPGMALPEGPHRIVVSREDYEPFTGTVEILGDTEFAVMLDRLPQPFSVAASPANAVVELLDAEFVYSPEVPLPASTYSLEVTLPGYTPWTGEARHGGTATTVAVSLEFEGAEYADVLASGGDGPMMVVVPAGTSRMGCRAPAGCSPSELPTHDVALATAFAMSKHEITFIHFDRFAQATGRALPDDFGWRRNNRPVINVTWEDANAYAGWLTMETGRTYRLPSESEWEYAARGGLDAVYGLGDSIAAQANCGDCIPTGGRRTLPAGSFQANAWGLHDMHGNVWEWVADCWNASHDGTPGDGSTRLGGDCGLRVLRGGSWFEDATFARAAKRLRGRPASRANIVGFRVVAELP